MNIKRRKPLKLRRRRHLLGLIRKEKMKFIGIPKKVVRKEGLDNSLLRPTKQILKKELIK